MYLPPPDSGRSAGGAGPFGLCEERALMSTQSPAGDSVAIELNQLISRENVYRNLHAAALVEHSLRRGEGTRLASNGALVGWTGKRTGRSPKDKFTVKDARTADTVHWGQLKQPIEPQ